MKKETTNRIRQVYGIVLSAAAITAGICLMVVCAGIYFSGGDDPFSRQAVAEGFATIAVPVYICLALVIAGFLLDFALPVSSQKVKAQKNPAATLARLMSKRTLENCDPALKEQILALEKQRKKESIIGLALLALCSIAFLIYICNPTHFHQSEINASMAKAVMILFFCLAVPFGYALGAAYRARKSLQQQIELVKGIEPTVTAKKETKSAPVLRWVILVVAVALLAYGFFTGGTADVLTKAVNICTECVGLG